MKEEIEKLVQLGVWNWKEVREWSKVAEQDKTARKVVTHMLLGIKFFEKGEAYWKFKGRLVALGNNVRNSEDYETFEDSLYAVPAGVSTARLTVGHSMTFPDGTLRQSDIDNACIKAKRPGSPIWISLPNIFCPAEWGELKDPVVPLDQNLYCMKNAGSDYSKWAAGKLLGDGWPKLRDVDGGVFMKGNVTFALYVDDGLLSGPRIEVTDVMLGVRRCLNIKGGDYDACGFLQLETSKLTQVGKYKRFRTISQQMYTDHVLTNYKADLGTQGPLKKVPTPTFDYEYVKGLEEVPGKFGADFGRKHIRAAMHLARYTRLDISFAVGVLARDVNGWSAASEKRMHQLMEYLETTIEFKLVLLIDMRDVHALVQESSADAVHGGCPFTRKSTSGWAVLLIGSNDTMILFDWGSRLQKSAAKSTGEAELLAAADLLSRPALHILSLLEDFFGPNYILHRIKTDLAAALGATKNGFSISMRYMKKYQGMSLAFVHDATCGDEKAEIALEETAENYADVFTNSLEQVKFQRFREALILLSPEQLSALSSKYSTS